MGFAFSIYPGDALAPVQTHTVCPRCGEAMGRGVTIVAGTVVRSGMCARCLMETWPR